MSVLNTTSEQNNQLYMVVRSQSSSMGLPSDVDVIDEDVVRVVLVSFPRASSWGTKRAFDAGSTILCLQRTKGCMLGPKRPGDDVNSCTGTCSRGHKVSRWQIGSEGESHRVTESQQFWGLVCDNLPRTKTRSRHTGCASPEATARYFISYVRFETHKDETAIHIAEGCSKCSKRFPLPVGLVWGVMCW